MEIKDFNELNALCKLLNKVKFQNDLDFREFAGSPLIADIYRRALEEYMTEAIKKGYAKEGQKATFRFDSRDGKILKMRIDELTENEIETLVKNNNLEDYISTLIAPLESSKEDFMLLKQYAENKFKSTNN